METDEKINKAVKQNEIQLKDWEYRELSEFLYAWFDRFNERFFGKVLMTPVISFERTSAKRLGHFVIDRNAFGLKGNININRLYTDGPKIDPLATLLHEELHLWQTNFGKKKKKLG